MKKQSGARISQCMIVKNEEEHIAGALSWGAGIVSEQIVVDTGSTDRTAEIARRMGAKVFRFEWIDDFSAAKNYALSKAKYDWIAFLDADEYFLREDAQKLPAYVSELQGTSCDGIQTAWVNVDAEGKVMSVLTQIRVFRNRPDLRYEGRIHEYLAYADGRIMEAADAVHELSIFHTGYSGETHQKKTGRNLRLIQKELEQHPGDYRMLGYLGKEYMRMKEYEKAEEAFRGALFHIPEERRRDYNGTTSEIALRLLVLLTMLPGNQEQAVREVYGQAAACWPEEADYDYTMGKYLASKKNYQEAAEHLRRALGILEQYGYREKSMLLSAEVPKACELLAVCCYNIGDLAGCVNCTTSMLKENPYLMSTLTVLLLAFRRDTATTAEAVSAFLGRSFYDFRTLKDRLFVLRAAMAADYEALTAVMRAMFTDQELAAVEQGLRVGAGSEESGEKEERR